MLGTARDPRAATAALDNQFFTISVCSENIGKVWSSLKDRRVSIHRVTGGSHPKLESHPATRGWNCANSDLYFKDKPEELELVRKLVTSSRNLGHPFEPLVMFKESIPAHLLIIPHLHV